MFTNFNGVYDLDKMSQLDLYISWKKSEKEYINKIIEYATDEPDAQSHIRFLERYQQHIQEHIDTLRKAIQTAKELSTKLNDFLKDLDIDSSFGNKDKFKIDDLQFYVSYNHGTLSFFTSIVYDPYLEKNIYACYDYKYNGKQLVPAYENIGSTEKTIAEIRKHPSYLLEEINKMDDEDSYEGVNARYKKCEQLLFNLLNVEDFRGLVKYEDPYFKFFFEKPIDLFRKMAKSRTDNVTKLQLRNNGIDEITEDLISLIKVEHDLLELEGYKDLFKQNEYEELKKKDINKKNTLLENVGIDQETLDNYMSFINLDKE